MPLVKFQDNFDTGTVLDSNNWISNAISGYTVSIENKKLKFYTPTGTTWCGAYVQPKTTISKNQISELGYFIEFDYTIGSNHYNTANKPYVAVYNAAVTPVRDKYDMASIDANSGFVIFLAANNDTSARTRFYLYSGATALKTVTVNYPTGTTIHMKIVLSRVNKSVALYVDNNTTPLIESVIPGWDTMGNELIFEMNSNSYNTFIEYYDNFVMGDLLELYFLIRQSNSYYSIKSNYYDTNAKNFLPLALTGGLEPNKADISNFGFYNLNDICNSITVNGESFRPVDKLYTQFEVKGYRMK